MLDKSCFNVTLTTCCYFFIAAVVFFRAVVVVVGELGLDETWKR